MDIKNLIAQLSGLIGFVIVVASFQIKDNKKFLITQGFGCFMFVINFLLIGAWGGVLYNFSNFLRGFLFAKNDRKVIKLVAVELLFVTSFVISVLSLNGNIFDILISALPFLALSVMAVFMWLGNPVHIRVFQTLCLSPAWIVYNIFNFTLGGLLCESFNMVSCVIALIRFKKENNS